MPQREQGKRSRHERQQHVARIRRHPRSAPVLLVEQAVYAVLFLSVALTFSLQLRVQYTLPKLACLRLLVPCIAVLWLIRLHRDQIKPIPVWVLRSAAALTLWWLVSTFFALHLPTALFGRYGRYNGLWTHLTCMTLFLFAASSAMRPEMIERLVKVLIAALVPVAIYAVYQYFVPNPSFPERRAPSTIGHPVICAATLGLVVPFIVTFLSGATRKRERYLWGTVLVVTLAGAAATLSRGPWVGIAAALAVVLLGRLRESQTKTSITNVAVLVAVCTALAALLVYAASQLRVDAYAAFVSRFTFYDAALAIVRDYPVTGVGFESFALAYPRYRPVEDLGDNVVPSMVHDGYLQLAVTNGIPALVLYVVFLLTVALALRRAYQVFTEGRARALTIAFAASIVGYLIQDISGWLEISLSAFFWVLLGLAVSWSTQGHPSESRLSPRARALGYSWGAIAICGSLALFAQTIQEIRADALLARAEAGDPVQHWPFMERDIAAALNDIQHDAAYLDRAATLYAQRMLKVGDHAAYEHSAALLEEARTLNPFDSYVLIHRIDLDAMGVQRGAIRATSFDVEGAMRAALQMDKNNPTVYAACARLRAMQQRFTEALPFVEKAIALRPDDAQYRLLRADVLRLGGVGAGGDEPRR